MKKLTLPDSKEEALDLLRKTSAEIGMMEAKRKSGTYVSGNAVLQKRREFKKLSDMYKRKFYQL